MSAEYITEIVFDAEGCQIRRYYHPDGCGCLAVWTADNGDTEFSLDSLFAKMILFMLKNHSKDEIMAAINGTY